MALFSKKIKKKNEPTPDENTIQHNGKFSITENHSA